MSQGNAADTPGAGNAADSKQLLDRFDRAWRSGTPPRMEEYLALLAPARWPSAACRDFLEELVRVDLEYRWRGRASPGAPMLRPATKAPEDRLLLEDYARRYPQLGRPEQLSLELVAWEYRVRQRWGDRPQHPEYLRRFPHLGQRLVETLAHIDAELAVEFDPTGNKMSPGNNGLLDPAIIAAVQSKPPVSQPHLSPSTLPSVDTLVDTMRRGQVLSAAQLQAITPELQRRFGEPRVLARELLQRGWLTAFQVNQLLQGRGADLTVGPFVLLERLGEGGAGQVYKARHQKLGCLVALKILRKELLSDAEMVGRFAREIQIVRQLDHPNLVRAVDAGSAAATLFLAMEYVEGTNLARLVKPGSPLPVQQACAYIRQAALGLQYAHERGLVHRDIKPHNLIMSLRDGLIKVADLGLARLCRPANDQATAMLTGGIQGTGSLTPQDAVMLGTADYMAPEQALDFHRADIRADIYSLGCTFYYLLTSQPPFPGGTLAEKVLKHQQAEPREVGQFRNDAPRELAGVLRKMLAKRPADRFQTPAEVAQALAVFGGLPGNGVGSLTADDALKPTLVQRAKQWLGWKPPRRRILLAGLGVTVLLGAGLGWWLLRDGERVYLSDIAEEKAIIPWGGEPFGKNGIFGNTRITVHGHPWNKGLGMTAYLNASARVSYRLNKQYRHFNGIVAVPDLGPAARSSLIFDVICDGTLKWQSKAVQKPGDQQPFSLRVAGVDVLELTVSSSQGPSGYTPAVWLDPYLTK